MKIVKYGEAARAGLVSGVKQLTQAVASTLGAAGKGVIIDDVTGMPYITADGITVAEAFELEQPFEQIGVALVKTVCREANKVGDGTTTATVLANEIIEKSLGVKNQSPILLKRGMEKASYDIIAHLKEQSKKIKNRQELINISTISARGDKELGKLIADAFKHTGKNGQIVVEEGRGETSKIEKITGYQVEKGYYSDSFINNKKRNTVEYVNPYILATDIPIRIIDDVNKIFEAFSVVIGANKKLHEHPLVIIAPEIDEKSLLGLQSNNFQGVISCTFVEAPEFGDRQTATIEDICYVLGSVPHLEQNGASYTNLKPTNFGTCEKFLSNKESSVFINWKRTNKEVDDYANSLPIVGDKDFHKKRVARLAGRLAKLIIGAKSSVEMREKRDRTEDALNATRSAMEEGYVVGGGMALLKTYLHIHSDLPILKTKAEEAGYNIILESIKAPFQQILKNLYGEDTDSLNTTKDEVIQALFKNNNYGFDVKAIEICDMIERGIIDPVKVTISSLEAACSVAMTIINTDCIIAITGDENKEITL